MRKPVGRILRWLCLAILVSPLSLVPQVGLTHGGLGHIQVTAWAVENLPQSELRSFLANEEVFNSVLLGSAYPDIGYYPGLKYPELARQFAEYSHWPFFTESFIQWIRDNDPPPWNSIESRKRIAFLLGAAAHGFQDEVFDSLFLDQIEHHDGAGQVEADSGTDGFLVMDLLIGTIPESDVPVDALLYVYNNSGEFDEEIVDDHILSSLDTMTDLYIDEGAGPVLAQVAANNFLDVLIWTRENYMNPDIPGSLHAEVYPTMHYIQDLWKQLQDDYSDEDVLMFSFPEGARRLRSHESNSPDSWVSFLFSSGIKQGQLNSTWTDAEGNAVAYEQKGGAWGGGWPRIMRLQPTENLVPGAYYTTTVSGTADGAPNSSWTLDHTKEFQVACTEDNADACPEITGLEPARLDRGAEFQAEWALEADSEQESFGKDDGCQAVNMPRFELWVLLLGLGFLRRRFQKSVLKH